MSIASSKAVPNRPGLQLEGLPAWASCEGSCHHASTNRWRSLRVATGPPPRNLRALIIAMAKRPSLPIH